MPIITTSKRTGKPLIPITMISHGTLASIDLQASRRFHEEVLGFEVIQLSPMSMLLRRGTDHTYVVVETGEEVERAHRTLREVKDEYGIRRINPVMEQHGVYSFYFQDLDATWWEITAGRPRGYTWVYDNPARDISGRTDVDLELMEHVFDDDYAERLRAG